MSSSSALRPSMICANTLSAAATTSSSSCNKVSKMGSNRRSKVYRPNIFSRFCTKSMQIHCKQAIRTTMLSLECIDWRSWSTSLSTGMALCKRCTISSRPLFISMAMRAISSSLSSMQCKVPPNKSGNISTHLPSELSIPFLSRLIFKWTYSCNQHNAVNLAHASVCEQQDTTMPAVSEMISMAFSSELEVTPFSKSFKHASALCRMSRDWSPNMLNKPWRY
mmetsp:Transcript_101512/g.254488  ORF Transcript_101512/g.254488 Transcript_101512/m.254488 type:complete len:222 (+) Transcript_101512:821-1486(+)